MQSSGHRRPLGEIFERVRAEGKPAETSGQRRSKLHRVPAQAGGCRPVGGKGIFDQVTSASVIWVLFRASLESAHARPRNNCEARDSNDLGDLRCGTGIFVSSGCMTVPDRSILPAVGAHKNLNDHR